jgi:hypothetical protein
MTSTMRCVRRYAGWRAVIRSPPRRCWTRGRPSRPAWPGDRIRCRPGLPQSEGIAFIEAGKGKVHLSCKDVSV